MRRSAPAAPRHRDAGEGIGRIQRARQDVGNTTRSRELRALPNSHRSPPGTRSATRRSNTTSRASLSARAARRGTSSRGRSARGNEPRVAMRSIPAPGLGRGQNFEARSTNEADRRGAALVRGGRGRRPDPLTGPEAEDCDRAGPGERHHRGEIGTPTRIHAARVARRAERRRARAAGRRQEANCGREHRHEGENPHPRASAVPSIESPAHGTAPYAPIGRWVRSRECYQSVPTGSAEGRKARPWQGGPGCMRKAARTTAPSENTVDRAKARHASAGIAPCPERLVEDDDAMRRPPPRSARRRRS